MQRAIARQTEVERERRAKVINAEGEFQGGRQARGSLQHHRKPPRRPAAALPADHAGNGGGKQLDGVFASPDRTVQALPSHAGGGATAGGGLTLTIQK